MAQNPMQMAAGLMGRSPFAKKMLPTQTEPMGGMPAAMPMGVNPQASGFGYNPPRDPRSGPRPQTGIPPMYPDPMPTKDPMVANTPPIVGEPPVVANTPPIMNNPFHPWHGTKKKKPITAYNT